MSVAGSYFSNEEREQAMRIRRLVVALAAIAAVGLFYWKPYYCQCKEKKGNARCLCINHTGKLNAICNDCMRGKHKWPKWVIDRGYTE